MPRVKRMEDRWLTPRLEKMKLDEKGMCWHAFKRFRKTWLRGERCLEDMNNFWLAHKPQTMSEQYSHLHEEVEKGLDEATRVGYGFTLPPSVVPIVPKLHRNSAMEVAAYMIERARVEMVGGKGLEPLTPCL